MFGLGRIIGLAVSLGCGLVTSQAPELAQQYQQRLHGALGELQEVVAAFDADAARSNLQRPEALDVYQASEDAFLRDRGQSVRATIDRLDALSRHSAAFQALPAAARPLALVKGPDTTILTGALGDFEPAVPVALNGLLWAGAGFLFGFGLWSLLGRMFRGRRARSVPAGRV